MSINFLHQPEQTFVFVYPTFQAILMVYLAKPDVTPKNIYKMPIQIYNRWHNNRYNCISRIWIFYQEEESDCPRAKHTIAVYMDEKDRVNLASQSPSQNVV